MPLDSPMTRAAATRPNSFDPEIGVAVTAAGNPSSAVNVRLNGSF